MEGAYPAVQTDWVAAERLASTLGPRSRRLVLARNQTGLELWLPTAAALSRRRSPAVADLYEQLAELVGIKKGGSDD